MTHDQHARNAIEQTEAQIRDLNAIRQDFVRAGYHTVYVDNVLQLYIARLEKITGRKYEGERAEGGI